MVWVVGAAGWLQAFIIVFTCCCCVRIQCESKKNPPEDLWQFFRNGWEFFNQILHAYYAFMSTLDCKFLSNYLHLWRSYAILSVTTQFTSRAHNVHPETHAGIFWYFFQTVRNFSPNFTRLSYYTFIRTLECKFVFNYLQLWRSYAILSATTQRGVRPMVDVLSTLWWSRLIWHNFVKVADNWTKICSPA